MPWWPVLVTGTWHSSYILPLICHHYCEKWMLDEETRAEGWQIDSLHCRSFLTNSEGCCVKPHVMICISSQSASRPGEETKGHFCGSDGRLLFYCLIAYFTGMVDPSNTPSHTIKNLTFLGKFLFHFLDFFLVFVQCLTKWALIIWNPDHRNNSQGNRSVLCR